MQSPDSDAPVPDAMYSPAQLRLLKIAVIGMGVILLVGFTVVIGRIIYLVNSTPAPGKAGTPSLAVPLAPLAAPPSLALPKGATVRGMAISGSRLAVHYDGPGGAGIRIVDLVPDATAVDIRIVEDGAPRRP